MPTDDRSALPTNFSPRATPAAPRQSPREDAFSEVIYGLSVLLKAVDKSELITTEGILLALEYVKAMVEEEQ